MPFSRVIWESKGEIENPTKDRVLFCLERALFLVYLKFIAEILMVVANVAGCRHYHVLDPQSVTRRRFPGGLWPRRAAVEERNKPCASARARAKLIIWNRGGGVAHPLFHSATTTQRNLLFAAGVPLSISISVCFDRSLFLQCSPLECTPIM